MNPAVPFLQKRGVVHSDANVQLLRSDHSPWDVIVSVVGMMKRLNLRLNSAGWEFGHEAYVVLEFEATGDDSVEDDGLSLA